MTPAVRILITCSVKAPIVPPPPGTIPIPPGMERRFHYTSIKNVPTIRKYGLTIENASPYAEGGQGIYSWWRWDQTAQSNDTIKDGKAIVEFWDDPKNYTVSRTLSRKSVKPNQIIAIHLPWHDSYRYCKENNIPLNDIKDAAKYDPEKYLTVYKALQYEQERKK